MTSAIDVTKPVTGQPTTASVRANFATAAQEISTLQQDAIGAPFLPLAGGTMEGPLSLANDPTSGRQPVTLDYFHANGGGGSGGAGAVPEAPNDGTLYGRQSGGWVHAAAPAALAAYLPLAGGTMTGAVKQIDGTAAAPSFTFANDATSGFYRAGANAVGLAVGGVAVLHLDNLGNAAGLGLTSPTGASFPTLLWQEFITPANGQIWFNGYNAADGVHALAAGYGARFTQNSADGTVTLQVYPTVGAGALFGSPGQFYFGTTGGFTATQVWTSSLWVDVNMAGPGTTALLAPYAPLASPTFSGDPKAPTAAAGDNDTSIATTAFVQAAAAPALNSVGRNKLHNPMFRIAQRGAGPWTTSAYTADRWIVQTGTDVISVALAGAADGDRSGIGDEAATTYLLANVAGNAGATAFTYFGQRIEDVRRLSGKTITISFWARANAGTPKIGLNVQQNFGTGGSPSGAVYATGGNVVTLSTAWARYTTTMFLPSTAGKTLGTNNDHYSEIQWWLSGGANWNGATGSIGPQTAVFSLWGMQVEVGSVATPLDKPDPRVDLANCQRFFASTQAFLYGYSVTGGQIGVNVPLPVAMRANPSVGGGTSSGSNTGGLTWGVLGGNNSVFVVAAVTATGTGVINCTFTAAADL